MKQNIDKILLYAVIIAFFSLSMILLYVFYKPHRNIQREELIIISAEALTGEYEEDKEAANILFFDKMLKINGVVKNIEENKAGKHILTLSGKKIIPGVRATLRHNMPVRIGDTVTLKGHCTGFLDDVIIIDCLFVDR